MRRRSKRRAPRYERARESSSSPARGRHAVGANLRATCGARDAVTVHAPLRCLLRRVGPSAHRRRPVCGGLAAIFALVVAQAALAEPAPDWLRAALEAACTEPQGAEAVLGALGGGIELSSEALDAPRGLEARRHRLLRRDGGRLRLDRHLQGEALRQVILEWHAYVGAERRPQVWIVADGRCRVRVARRLVYRDGPAPAAVEDLAPDLVAVRSRHLLDEVVPPGAPPPGVPVALVDSGVNYTLPRLAARLARDPEGRALGFDYWDQDPRPFDHHPSPSPFVPRRHGTRTASLLLDEAPVATLVPMRYPRPDMSRMTRLVADAARAGVGIVNLSLGGRDAAKWRHFERAALAHPGILFVASAGNDGRDLDREPVYPAALDLPNLITVSSADAQGLPARGSNWGRRTVDLLVPAEDLVSTDYNGYATRVSGSSYAAVRISALAACLKARHPTWRAAELKQAIFARAVRAVHPSMGYVAVGLVPDPTLERRGECDAQPASASRLGRMQVDAQALYPDGAPQDVTHELAPLTLMWIRNAGWTMDSVLDALVEAAEIYRQCGVRFRSVHVELWRLPFGQLYYDTANALALMRTVDAAPPVVWFMRDTLQQPAFDAEAIGRSNARGREPLMHTLWLTSHLEHAGVALAHELYHALADTGGHVPERGNLMHAETHPGGTTLEDWQCERLLRVGDAFGLLRAIR